MLPLIGPGRISATEEIGKHTSELQSHSDLVCRLLLEKKKEQGRRLSAVAREQQLRVSRLEVVEVVVRFFFNDAATTEIYTLSLHDALPISRSVSLLTTPESPSLQSKNRSPARTSRMDKSATSSGRPVNTRRMTERCGWVAASDSSI